jgi:hypothetical protein
MPSPELLIPWALGPDERVIAAHQAEYGVEYRCPLPSCRANLIVRAGERVTKHFAHPGRSPCSGESVAHWAAKYRVAEVVNDWVRGAATSPVIHRRCPQCNRRRVQSLPSKVAKAVVELSVGKHRPDVVLVDENGASVAAVEIFVTHEVDEAKAKALSIPWLEIEGEAVLREPLSWVPRQHGNLRPLPCDHMPEYLGPPPGECEVWLDGAEFPGYQITTVWDAARQLHQDLRAERYGAGGTEIEVLVDTAEGRYIGSWRSRGWVKPLKLLFKNPTRNS